MSYLDIKLDDQSTEIIITRSRGQLVNRLLLIFVIVVVVIVVVVVLLQFLRV